MGLREIGELLANGKQCRELYRQGMAAFNRADYRTAIDALGRIPADRDNLHSRLAKFYLGHAHCQLGLEAMNGGDYPAAVTQLQLACHYNPAGGDLARHLAVALVGSGRDELVAGPLERALTADRQDFRARVMLAHHYWRTGQSERAELVLHEALGARGEDPLINFHLALLAAQNEQWDVAEQRLARCVEADESNVQAWRYLGLACGAQGEPTRAVEHLRRAQRLDPNDPHIALELALAAAAVEDAAPRLRLAPMTQSQPRADDVDRLTRALTREPELIAAFMDLEPSPMDQQIFGLLSSSLDLAVERHPRYADLHYYVSRAHGRLGRVGQAIESAERAIALNPRYAAALLHAGQLHRRTGDRGLAVQRLRSAVQAGADYPDIHATLGDIHREMGQTELARESYLRALSLRSDYPAAKQGLAELAA